MEIRQLRYFAAVAQHGSFNRAGIHLRLTQPALSRKIRELEEEIGAALFERGRNGAKLTSAGASFLAETNDILARLQAAKDKIRLSSKNPVLRIGYAPSAAAGILPIALQRMRAAAPEVRVELWDLAEDEIVAKLRSRELDVAIAITDDLNFEPGLKWTAIRHLRPVLVLAKSHPLSALTRFW